LWSSHQLEETCDTLWCAARILDHQQQRSSSSTTIMTANSSKHTVSEREAELIALQSAFDEYIASSRELEEELDAELSKMRKSLDCC
jgi:hypothetical protein